MDHHFIVIDGVEGCGKSTQAKLLATAIERAGGEVVLTREPGGTAVGAKIRQLLLDRSHPEMTALTELMLFCADRAQHVAEVIRPALDAGKIVVCDRFASSTAAYQGHAGGLAFDLFDQVNSAATEGLLPHMTVVLDIDPRIGFERKFGGDGGQGDRIEQKALDYHQMVREGFVLYAERLGERAVVLDADKPPEPLQSEILGILGLV